MSLNGNRFPVWYSCGSWRMPCEQNNLNQQPLSEHKFIRIGTRNSMSSDMHMRKFVPSKLNTKKCFSCVRSTKNNKNWWKKLHKLLPRFTHVFGAFNWVSSATSGFLNIVVTRHAISMWSETSGPDPLRHCGNCLWLDGQAFYVKLLRRIGEDRDGDANTISIRLATIILN